MVAQGAVQVDEGRWGISLVYGSAVPAKARPKGRAELPPVAIPDWARRPAPAEARPPRPLAPSAIGHDTDAAPPPSDAMRAAARRGSLIHQLLERLAPVAPDDRLACALRWLEHSAGVADAEERADIAKSVCDVLSDASFAPLFGPGSLGEAPLAATLPDGRVIAGTADRLLVEDRRILVVDFKTGRVPAGPDDIPRSHRAQMTAYAEALGVIFPGREVRAALLYTSVPRLFELAS
jgi:ATP-dependent helicase/nuclease subunit A